MSRRRRSERAAEEQRLAEREATPIVEGTRRAVPFADVWLLLAFLLPNVVTLAWGFVYDDGPIIVENAKLHSLSHLGGIWTGGYWPDRPGLVLYRPVSQSLWAFLWSAGGGRPLPFHALSLLLGATVVVLAFRLLVSLRVEVRIAFLAALLFAVLPVHVEATASVVGSAELLAAALGVGALLAYRRNRRWAALGLWTIAVFAKESAAALPALIPVFLLVDGVRRVPWRTLGREAVAVGAVVVVALAARNAVAVGPPFIPAIDNPMALVDPGRRVLTALWVQVLYLARAIVPFGLSADYSYKQVPLVMGLHDVRAWAGLVIAGAAVLASWKRPASRLPMALWVAPFLPTANLLFPIGTMMGERLAYLPTLGLTLGAAMAMTGLGPGRRKALIALVVAIFSFATWNRNLVWKDADSFYPALVESAPGSARAWYSLGVWHAARWRDAEALEAYDRAVGIFVPYPEAWNNRGNALVALGRLEDAKESYRQAVRFDPGHKGAAASLEALELGLRFEPKRKKL